MTLWCWFRYLRDFACPGALVFSYQPFEIAVKTVSWLGFG